LKECDGDVRRHRSTHGNLEPGRGRSRFTLTRLEPSPDLSGHVERHWIVRWSLPEDEPFVYPGRPLSGRVRARCARSSTTAPAHSSLIIRCAGSGERHH